MPVSPDDFFLFEQAATRKDEEERRKQHEQEKNRPAPPTINVPEVSKPKGSGHELFDMVEQQAPQQEYKGDTRSTAEQIWEGAKSAPRTVKDLFTAGMTSMVGGTMKGASGVADIVEQKVLPKRAAEGMKRARVDFVNVADKIIAAGKPASVRKKQKEGTWDGERILFEGADIAGQLMKYGSVASATGGAGVLGLAAMEGAGNAKIESMARLADDDRYTDQEKEDISNGVAAVAGVAEAALQYLPAKFIGGKFGRQLEDRVIKSTLGRVAKGTAEWTSESVEEMGVGAAGDAAQYFLENKADAFKGFWRRRAGEAAAGLTGMGMARGVQVSQSKLNKLADKFAEVGSTEAGRSKLEALGEIENPSRGDLRKAGITIRGNLNATDRMVVRDMARSVDEFDTHSHQMEKLAGRSSNYHNLSDMDRRVAADLAEKADTHGLQSIGVTRADSVRLLKERWLAQDMENQKARLGGKKQLTEPRMTKGRERQLNELEAAWKANPDKASDVQGMLEEQAVKDLATTADAQDETNQAVRERTELEVRDLQEQKENYRALREKAEAQGDDTAADAYRRLEEEAGQDITNHLTRMRQSETGIDPRKVEPTQQLPEPGVQEGEAQPAKTPDTELEPNGGLLLADPRDPLKPVTPDALREQGGWWKPGVMFNPANWGKPGARLADAVLTKDQRAKTAKAVSNIMYAMTGSGRGSARNRTRAGITEARRKIERRVEMLSNKIQQALFDYEAAAKKEAGVKPEDGVPERIADISDKFLKGEVDIKDIPKDLRTSLKTMRETIDTLSREALNSGAVTGGKFLGSVQARTAFFDSLRAQSKTGVKRSDLVKAVLQEGKAAGTKIDKATADAVVSIVRNEGLYLTRTYDAFDADANWKARMPDSVRDNMFKMLKQEEAQRVWLEEQRNDKRRRDGKPEKKIKPEMTDKQIRTRMNEILDQALESGNILDFNNGRVGQQNRSILKKRKNIAQVYREFLGEVRDPSLNYLRTVDKMNNLMAQFELAQDIRQLGMGDFLFEKDDPNRPEDATVLVADEGSKTQEPLAGLYAAPEVKQFMSEVRSIYDKAPWWLQKVYNLDAAFQRAKTSWSPQSHMRQIVGNPIMLMANGNFGAALVTPGKMLRQVPGFKQVFDKLGVVNYKEVGTKGKGTQEQRDYFNRATELGLVGQGVEYKLLKKYSRKRSRQEAIRKELDMGNMSLDKLDQKFGEQYAWEDSMFKLAAWEAEKSRYAKTGEYDMTNPDDVRRLEEDAAAIVRRTLPSYDELPKFIELVRSVPGVGMFMAFPASQVVNAANRAHLTYQELTSSNPKVRWIGARRAISQIATYSAPLILAKAVQAMLDIPEDEMEALRSILPSWARDATLIPLGRDDDGNIQYINMSYIDPHAYFIDPLQMILSGGRNEDQFTDLLWRGVMSIVEPYTQETMASTAVMDIMRNKTTYGSQVYDPDGGLGWAIFDGAMHALRGTIAPGAAISGERITKGFMGIHSKGGKVYNPWIELMSMGTGFKIESVSPKDSFDFRINDFKNRLKSSTNHLYRLDTEGNVPSFEIEKRIAQSDNTHRKAVEEMHAQYEAHRKLDPEIDRAHMYGMMKSRRVRDEDIDQAFTGIVEPRVPPTLKVMDRMLSALPEGERRQQLEVARDQKLTETIYKMGDPETDNNRTDIQKIQKEIAVYGLDGREGLDRMKTHLQTEKVERLFKKYMEATSGKFDPAVVRKLAVAQVSKEPFQWNKKRVYRALRIGLEMGMTAEEVMKYIGQGAQR